MLSGDRRARAVLGTLLAATVQRRPEIQGPPCRWLLAYRREHHGPLLRWLGDARREARALGFGAAKPGADPAVRVGRLPSDLATHGRFHSWPLPALGAGGAGAEPVFRAVLEKPLQALDAAGRPRYPWRFAGDGAARLATAFAAARAADPEAPLVPELQVVLADLMAGAGPPRPGQAATLTVPDDPAALIDSALAKHLARALDLVFIDRGAEHERRLGKTRALLALRQLADVHGRRGDGEAAPGRPADALSRAIGRQGREILEALQAPGIRLVAASEPDAAGVDPGDGGTYFTLTHDRLADVIKAAVDGEGGLAVDPELLSLAHLVALRTELFHTGERRTSTAVSAAQVKQVERHADCLLIDPERRSWWAACLERRRIIRRGQRALVAAGFALLAFAAWLAANHAEARAEREAVLENIALGAPEAAFANVELAFADPDTGEGAVLERLGERQAPLDLLELGMGGVPEPRRSRLVLGLAELAIPWLHATRPDDTVALASVLWALDYGPGRDPELADRAAELGRLAVEPFRRQRPPPAPGADWVEIPAGRFSMGTPKEEGNIEDERPVRTVILAAFRMLDHEVTHAEYRRLFPDHPGRDDLPARRISWYDAVVYAAWLGGRLPTEAEWEYAARAGCTFDFCRRDGSEATVQEVAWFMENAMVATGAEARRQPVQLLEPNPWGLYDIHGNIQEWVSDWYGPYEPGPQTDPRGPTAGPQRTARSSVFSQPSSYYRAGSRSAHDPTSASDARGLRPVLPGSAAAAGSADASSP
ncbi:MAG: SUMF1/EgtB/PvdO family nonheme iron enzyme [Acidobacteriota bacterium]